MCAVNFRIPKEPGKARVLALFEKGLDISIKEKGGKVPPRNTELVFYAPSTDEYVEIDAEAVDFISEEAETSEELARLIQSA